MFGRRVPPAAIARPLTAAPAARAAAAAAGAALRKARREGISVVLLIACDIVALKQSCGLEPRAKVAALAFGSLFLYYHNMAKSIPVTRKKRGRPPTGQDPVKTVRLPPDLDQRISEWAKANGKDSHSEAMRHLLELGLSVPKRGRGAK